MNGYFELDGFDRASGELIVTYSLPGLSKEDVLYLFGLSEEKDTFFIGNIPIPLVDDLAKKFNFDAENQKYVYELSYYED